ncbi:hypothetical protein C6P46_002444 [Rhodotorula mucilaginosa]|uniref:DUF952 domain-containing protein n=1 Tax=Rhodotorula mucilaginosa TaxID=5537 RepID=A0A9P6W4B8_RHOMI|nr:hypothetical protein C6P46_002444 [Rhodotorula mucilaginosa]
MLRRFLASMFGNSPSGPNGVSYIYRIMQHSSQNPRYTFPVPIPAKHEFLPSELDAKDGFVHFSTAKQLPATLNRFFADAPVVTILKCDYGRLSAWKVVKWEAVEGGETFPHLYAQLEGENVESHKDLVKGDGQTSWDHALEKARQEGWLQD